MKVITNKNRKSDLEYFLEISVDLMAIIGKDGTVKNVSKCCSDVLGWKEYELLGDKWIKFVHEGDFNRALNIIHSKKSGSLIRGIETRFRCKNNEYKIIEFNCIYIKEKEVYILAAKDISDKKRIEEQKLIYEKAKEIDNIKSEFFSNISHEFKTPLNIILASMQMINKNIDDNKYITNENENLKKYMNSIRQNCYRLLRLVNNIIDVNKINNEYYDIELGDYNIINIVEDITMSVLEYIKSNGIELIFDTEIEELIIACDPDKIERIILNLLSNAIKYTRENGKICVNIKSKNEYVYISVSDNGIGIPKEKIDTIFERYAKVDNDITRKFNGSGIGLALVKSLVKMHNGEVYVESEINKGSEFTIKLPIRQIKENNKIYKNLTESKVEKCSIEFADIYR